MPWMFTSTRHRRRLNPAWICIAFLLPLSAWSNPPEPVSPGSVVVVANSFVPGSRKVAKTYMKMREIPEENLIVIRSTDSEQISRESYLNTIHNPILEALLERELIDALDNGVDSLGRRMVINFSNPIKYLVLCYGVPVKIATKGELDDRNLIEMKFSRSLPSLVENFTTGQLAINRASVDGELALLLQKNVPLHGFVPNPYFRNWNPERVRDTLKVTRLDGPSVRSVLRMLENTLEGERSGLRGRAYVDLDGRGGSYQMGNDWLVRTADIFREMGYDLGEDQGHATFRSDDRFDAPVLYAGWYAARIDGPFLLPDFAFPPGAIAAHLHSFSAGNIRSTEQNWVGPLIERGVTATFGNTSEPYLRFTHQFDKFFAALSQGWNFADAAYLALPSLSWQAVAIGDPLYRPFDRPLGELLKDSRQPEEILLDQYVAIRQANLLAMADKPAEAIRYLQTAMHETPGPALALRLAQLLDSEGNVQEARSILSPFASMRPLGSSDWGLMAEMADTLLRMGDAPAAFLLYKRLEKVVSPEQVRLAFLRRGIQAAEEAGKPAIASEWRSRVTPPQPPPAEEFTPPEPEVNPVPENTD